MADSIERCGRKNGEEVTPLIIYDQTIPFSPCLCAAGGGRGQTNSTWRKDSDSVATEKS